MKKYILLLIVSLLMSSCATIFSKKEQYIQVASNSTNATVNVNDIDYVLPAKIKVERSKKDLKLLFSNDSLEKELTLKARMNSKFIVGNLFFCPPLSYIVDCTNDKRFGYKKTVYIKVKDSSARFSSIPFDKRIANSFEPSLDSDTNNLKFHFSLPWMNGFSYSLSNGKRVNSFGFLGVSGGLDYFYNKNNFVSIRTDAITNFFLPIPAPVSRDEGEYTDVYSINFSVLNSTKLNKFVYGYGLNYASNHWKKSILLYDQLTDTYLKEIKKSVNQNIGLNLNGYFQMTDHFYLGLVYKPSFITFDSNPKFNYDHTISLDLAWKINLFNLKNKK
jgi:hypothetical protein